MPPAQKFQQTILICAVLAVLTFAAFWNVQRNDFVNYDDPDYVTENPHVQGGLLAKNVKWAFQANHSSNWHPLTWLSHMADVSFFGMKPAGHHRTSLVFHAANAILLFLLLHTMTGANWRSAFVAGFFALHPLRVESVAWIAERKDVLSTFFGLLALLAYVRYARKPSLVRYVSANVLFALGLMSKPMLVTLPFLLLLLDFWPLKRMAGMTARIAVSAGENDKTGKAKARPVATPTSRTFLQLLQEKIPFFILTLIACKVTVWAQKSGGAVRTLTEFPLSLRVDNAIISYLRYIEKMFWPDQLAVFYPHPHKWPGWLLALSILVLVGVTFAAVKWMRRAPFLGVGWFWFLGTLVPVIGIVQVGIQSMADRYTYLPMIGLYIVVVWGAGELLARLPRMKSALALAGGVALAACFMVTRAQVERWRNSETLFRHALKVTKDNYTAHQNLGIILAKQGNLPEAREHFLAGMAIYPQIGESHHNLGNALMNLGHMAEAKTHYEKAVQLKPDYDAAYMNLGLVAVREGNMERALGYYAKVVELKPNDPVGHYNLGTAYFELGKLSEASGQYALTLQLQPGHFPALFQLGKIANAQGRRDEAIGYFRQVLELKPDHAEAQAELAGLGAR